VKIVLFANTDWYLYNFRRSLALALRDAGHELLLISPAGPYGKKLRALGLRWEPVLMDRRSLNPLREAALLWHLWTLFRRERPGLVHGFTIKCAVYGSLAARAAGVPARVNAVAGMGYVFTSDDLKARLLRPLVRLLMRAALGGDRARLILQNPDDVALFEDAGLVKTSHIRLIRGSGVDCSRFVARSSRSEGGVCDAYQPPSSSPRMRGSMDVSPSKTGSMDPRTSGDDEQGQSNTNPLRVLLAARLLWDKGLAEFVDAARRLHGEGRAIEFLLAGDPDPGNPAAVPEATVRGWVEEGVLQWLGHVDDMSALFADVDVVVLPSYREGLPKGLIEAAACALPLVTTDVPGCREVVSDGIDGLLVPPRDADALAAAIARLQDDPALGRRLGDAARAKALACFDERIVVADTMAVYGELSGNG
jgi:glycosyltransferase involved in cell wall biosynthesis